MQYVIVLALMTLYGGAIIFTNLVGEGLIYDDPTNRPPEALDYFGTVSKSLFSLFELMNGDTSVIEPIKDLVIGRLLFAAFMVISNWAILAILTAVVSDQMIAASNDYQEEEKKSNDAEEESKNMKRLLHIFEDNDHDMNGLISKDEWMGMLEDPSVCLELSEGTHLGKSDLADLFDCLAVEGNGDDGKVQYTDLIHSLKANSSVADKRAVLHVMLRLRIFQDQVSKQVEDGFADMKAGFLAMNSGGEPPQLPQQFSSVLVDPQKKSLYKTYEVSSPRGVQADSNLGAAVKPSGTRSSPPERVKASL